MKSKFVGSAVLVALLSFWCALAVAADKVTADEALERLMQGNKRFLERTMTACAVSNNIAREKLAKSQSPYAIILSCSDSRVPPEIIFDRALGEIFVVRVAGNVPDPIILGSIEYAAEHLGSPLIMVLGHERCGAVKATVDANGKGKGNIGAIVWSIAPALNKVKADCKAHKNCKEMDNATLVERVVDENVREVAVNLTKQSKVIRELVREGKVKIVTAKYDLDDGTVTILAGKK